MAKNMIGIDIGSSRIKAAFLSGNSLKFCVSEAAPDNLVKNGGIVSWDAMADELRNLIRKTGIRGKAAAIAMPSDEVYIRQTDLPLMTIQQLKVNLPYEFHDYITEDMDKYVYDYSVAGIEDKTMHLTAVAAGKALVGNYMDMCRRAKMDLKVLAPAVFALKNIVENFEKLQGIKKGSRDYAFLDLGNANIKVHFFTRGQYEVTRIMDIGLQSLVDKLAEVKGNDPHIARIELEQKQSELEGLPEITDLYDTMAVQVMRVLNFYNFNNPSNNIDTLYYYGGGAYIPKLLETIHETVQLPMEKAGVLLPESLCGEEGFELLGLQAIGIAMA
ncbi:MAG: pilus assembly protein PilM [Eubacterium sp.]|nr:pilus assembly protein PilM [Eubacterium sp.]